MTFLVKHLSNYSVDNRCTDTPEQINRYLKKISGPLLDRIDCHLEVSPVEFQHLSQTGEKSGETSAEVKSRVSACQQRQLNRQGKLNAKLTPQELNELVQPDSDSLGLLEKSVNQLGMSARSYHKVLRVALTLADMAADDLVTIKHVAEALSYRKLDKLS